VLYAIPLSFSVPEIKIAVFADAGDRLQNFLHLLKPTIIAQESQAICQGLKVGANANSGVSACLFCSTTPNTLSISGFGLGYRRVHTATTGGTHSILPLQMP
jgi:hypothetical protein